MKDGADAASAAFGAIALKGDAAMSTFVEDVKSIFTSVPKIQCPNCGGWKTDSAYKADAEIRLLVLFLLIGATILLPLVWWIACKIWDPNKTSPYTYECTLCGYKWEQKPNEILPITVNPDLIRLGEQQLEQERRRRFQED